MKLLEYDLTELEASTNPCAVVVLAHHTAQATRHDPTGRAAAKPRLARLLYQRGYDRATIERLCKLIDWLLQLPPELENATWYEIRAMEEEYQMPYVTTAERIGRAEGHAEGRAEGLHEVIAVALEERIAAAGVPLIAEISAITDPVMPRAIIARVMTAATPDDVRVVYEPGE